ncbi:glycine-rich cell wall structural protein isoform X3 [Fasciola gigantica]|uniref:Glycine-rich cell wall structural protein isoform X3 n=1 Tax=Fasciola gigantica TaxID=46835 RepID=A0A504Z5T6_FASGI|nr:glycine-rich cell wall structural protein isoform X3 [Fasciola gigantica]
MFCCTKYLFLTTLTLSLFLSSTFASSIGNSVTNTGGSVTSLGGPGGLFSFGGGSSSNGGGVYSPGGNYGGYPGGRCYGRGGYNSYGGGHYDPYCDCPCSGPGGLVRKQFTILTEPWKAFSEIEVQLQAISNPVTTRPVHMVSTK